MTLDLTGDLTYGGGKWSILKGSALLPILAESPSHGVLMFECSNGS
jgi:hypothetical protein